MRVCRYGLVAGLVQGVGFRAYVRRVARAAELGGYANNLPDGRVEVLLCGDAGKVGEVEALVALGPPAAQVRSIEWESRTCSDLDDFAIG